MILKPEQIKRRIIKAVGKGQSALLIGEWEEELINGLKENNILTISPSTKDFEDNTFTRIVMDYTPELKSCYEEIRRLLLPTGMLIVSANSNPEFIENLFSFFKKEKSDNSILKIKSKVLQDQIHDNGFLIDGYYGYPGGHILMMAIIQNKEVSTLFNTKEQVTIST